MNTNAILKASAVILVIAAIPAAILWQRGEVPPPEPRPLPAATQAKVRSAQTALTEPSPARPTAIRRPAVVGHSKDDIIADTPAAFAAQIRGVLKGEVS